MSWYKTKYCFANCFIQTNHNCKYIQLNKKARQNQFSLIGKEKRKHLINSIQYADFVSFFILNNFDLFWKNKTSVTTAQQNAFYNARKCPTYFSQSERRLGWGDLQHRASTARCFTKQNSWANQLTFLVSKYFAFLRLHRKMFWIGECWTARIFHIQLDLFPNSSKSSETNFLSCLNSVFPTLLQEVLGGSYPESRNVSCTAAEGI